MNITTKFWVKCKEKMLWYHVMTVLSRQTFQLKIARNWLCLFLMIAKKTGNLMKSLTVVGMIVVRTANVDVEDGLTNGASGVVKYIDYRMKGTNRPSIIWVLFNDPRIGRSAQEKYRALYNSSIQIDWTPVFDVQRTFILNYKTYQRIQFPLRPASGKTV